MDDTAVKTTPLRRIVETVLDSPWLSALAAVVVPSAILGIGLALTPQTDAAAPPLIACAAAVVIEAAALIRQVPRRAWWRVVATLALAPLVVILVVIGSFLMCALHDQAAMRAQDCSVLTLPDGLGTVALRIDVADGYEGWLPMPGRKSKWTAIIRGTGRQTKSVVIGDIMDSESQVEVFMLRVGGRRRLRFVKPGAAPVDVDLHAPTGRPVGRPQRVKLGGFYGGEFVPTLTATTIGGVFRPCDIAVGRNGEIYVAESLIHTVMRYTPDGRLVGRTNVATNQPEYCDIACRISTGTDGRLWVSNVADARISLYTSDGRPIREFRASRPCNAIRPPEPVSGIAAAPGRLYTTDRDGVVHGAAFDGAEVWRARVGDGYVAALCATPGGSALVVDCSGTITRFRADGKRGVKWQKSGIRDPVDIDVDTAGNVYIAGRAGNHIVIEKRTPKGAVAGRWNTDIGVRYAGPATAIAVGGEYLYATDPLRHRIVRFAADDGHVCAWEAETQ